jgi:hypothetical protein
MNTNNAPSAFIRGSKFVLVYPYRRPLLTAKPAEIPNAIAPPSHPFRLSLPTAPLYTGALKLEAEFAE